jgi:hypothetical protein
VFLGCGLCKLDGRCSHALQQVEFGQGRLWCRRSGRLKRGADRCGVREQKTGQVLVVAACTGYVYRGSKIEVGSTSRQLAIPAAHLFKRRCEAIIHFWRSCEPAPETSCRGLD